MYMDTVVIAGIGTVLLMFGFFGAVGAFVVYDKNRRKQEAEENAKRHG
ncbi:MAG: cytochrome c oxidase subunit CcoM [Marinobacter sp.]|nr:cytochrome c oxidase subunit CcoM [Marinobacter sp.]MDX1755626.1 cytochrome c oxidase subunit CcoM [Marinobacter sp.]